jgi:uncharacterized OsmC-like protein
VEHLSVRPLGGARYRIDVRGHEIVVDQPSNAGGDDTAATPTELFVAGLASCIAFYAGHYLGRHGLPTDGLDVRAEWAFAEGRPARVGDVRVVVTPPPGLPERRLPGLLAVARRCTVHNSLEEPPAVSVTLAAEAAAGAGPALRAAAGE